MTGPVALTEASLCPGEEVILYVISADVVASVGVAAAHNIDIVGKGLGQILLTTMVGNLVCSYLPCLTVRTGRKFQKLQIKRETHIERYSTREPQHSSAPVHFLVMLAMVAWSLQK